MSNSNFGMRERTMDDATVGRPERDRFSVTARQQLVAIVPRFVREADLEPSDDLLKRAEAGENEAIDLIDDISARAENIKLSLSERKPRAIKHRDGYLYIPTYSMTGHYFDAVGPVVCKTAEWRATKKIGKTEKAPCCLKPTGDRNQPKDGEEQTVVLLMVYDTDNEGRLMELPLHKRRRLDDAHRLHFSYTFQKWRMRTVQVQEWKKFHVNFPPISSDYTIFKKEGDKFAPAEYIATGESIWRDLGPAMVDRILEETEEKWGEILDTFGINYPDPDAMHKALMQGPSAVGAGNGTGAPRSAKSLLLH